MAELAAAGSVAGLVSVAIQSCQGLSLYYSAWKSQDENIRQTCQDTDQLKVTCEKLGRELQKVAQIRNPGVQQVFELIDACDSRITSLRDALEHCRSTRIPHNIATKLEQCRARALYPFKKHTIQSLKDSVFHVQRNLETALQVLQLNLHISLAAISSDINTTVHSNHLAIEALSSQQQTLRQAIEQQLTEKASSNVGAIRDEGRKLRHDISTLHQKVVDFADPARHIGGHPDGIETVIERHIDSAFSQHTRQQSAEIKDLSESIKNLQLGLISRPGLMQSVCDDNYRSQNLPTKDYHHGLELQRTRQGRRRTCNCQLKRMKIGSDDVYSSSYYEWMPSSKWKFRYRKQSHGHQHTCPLFSVESHTTVASLCLKSCGALLAGAIEASISITRGAGGCSISPGLQCRYVVPYESPAFRLVGFHDWKPHEIKSTKDLDALWHSKINQLERLFQAGQASPSDVDLQGNTLLHVASYSHIFLLVGSLSKSLGVSQESLCETLGWFIRRLQELHVPLGWTNDDNDTFMNQMTFGAPNAVHPQALSSSINGFLDNGAQITKFTCSAYTAFRGSFLYAMSTEALDALDCSELSLAILHRSEEELTEAIMKWPHLINHPNRLAQTPLHWSIGWAYGVQVLLQHGASVDSRDIKGARPIEYAIEAGFAETLALLMKAELHSGLNEPDILTVANNRYIGIRFIEERLMWDVSQEACEAVLDLVIVVLAQRRNVLQNRLSALSRLYEVDALLLRDDQVLDEHVSEAEQILENYCPSPSQASTLLPNLRTVYHLRNLTAEVAGKLWDAGFRDIDVPDESGLTPIMVHRIDRRYEDNFLLQEIDVVSWLINKGAKLHWPHASSWVCRPKTTQKVASPPQACRALHDVAFNLGRAVGYTTGYYHLYDNDFLRKPYREDLEKLDIYFSRLNTNSRQVVVTIGSSSQVDQCICACSSQGCLVATVLLKGFISQFYSPYFASTEFPMSFLPELLITIVGHNNSCWSWLTMEIIRFCTFLELELRHTCCRESSYHFSHNYLTTLESEEVAEIRDEDSEGIQLLESLLVEFEEKRGDQDLMTFLKGYWATRMSEVHRARANTVDKDKIRDIGVVLCQEGNDNEQDEIEEEDKLDEDEQVENEEFVSGQMEDQNEEKMTMSQETMHRATAQTPKTNGMMPKEGTTTDISPNRRQRRLTL